jgi:hypothetical protein
VRLNPGSRVGPYEVLASLGTTEGTVAAYSLDGKETFHVDARATRFRIAAWLDDGSLLAFTPWELPARLERYDPRTGKTSLFRTFAPLDSAGVAGITRLRITPDGGRSLSSSGA